MNNDMLTGYGGADVLTGDDGNDLFKYLAETDSGSGAGNRDIIVDFDSTQGDKIDLSAFAGDFIFKGTDSFTGTGNEVNYSQDGGNTIIGVDSNGNGALNFEIELAGLHTLTDSDFLL